MRGALAATAALISTLALLLLPPGAAAYAPVPHLEPDPWLDGNVTLSKFYPGWSPTEYLTASNESGQLPGELSPLVANPVFVNPTDISAPGVLQGDSVGAGSWRTSWAWQSGEAPGSKEGAIVNTTWNGIPAITTSLNTSSKGPQNVGIQMGIGASELPSTNPEFDYLTIGYRFSGPSCPYANSTPACTAQVLVENGSAAHYWAAAYTPTFQPTEVGEQQYPLPGQSAWISASLASMDYAHISVSDPGVNFFQSLNKSVGIFVVIQFYLPGWSGSSVTYNVTVTGMAISSAPLELGSLDYDQKAIVPAMWDGAVNLTAFDPSFSYAWVGGNGYTIALAEYATATEAGVTYTATSSGGSGTYVFPFSLPAAPDLTYGEFNLSDRVLLPGQYQFVDVGRANVTAYYQAPGYVRLASNVAVTAPGTWNGEVDYSGAEWAEIFPPSAGLFGAIGATLWGFLSEYWALFAIAGIILVAVVVARGQRPVRG
jgi:hypothetical protein